jgi:TRAP transporter 4TM/12TM fusion protein
MALALLVLTTSLYLVFFEDALHQRNEVPVLADLIFAGLAVLLALELARRTTGVVIPLLSLAAVTYILWWGNYISGVFHFRGLPLSRVLYRMYFTSEGMFGLTASISSTYVFLFILFGAFLLKSGAGDFIINLSRILTGRLTGGPALVAVLGSSLMGTISGSAVANVVSTGSITIPMMKRAGFKPRLAGAIEATASTGGQLMPPIMGAGAFVMAEYTQIPYTTIIAVSFLPAILYYAALGFSVVLEAKRDNIRGLTDDGPTLKETLRDGGHFFIPLGVLLWMLVKGYTPTYAAGISIAAVVASSWLSKSHRMGPRKIYEALEAGTRNVLSTGILLVTAGLIIGAIFMTGASVTFSYLIVELSGGHLLPALILITLASLVLGMGLPVTAAYIMVAVLAAPALTQMGVTLLAAHLIIFWLSQDSNVTPPVCLAAFAGAAIAGSPPMATGFTAWRLAKALYIVPLLFAYTPLPDGPFLEQIDTFVFGLLGFFTFAAGVTGYVSRPLNYTERSVLFALTFFLFWPHFWAHSICTSIML